MTALTLCVIICAAASFFSWLLSVITKDYSQVDRIWSIIPAVYMWVFAGYAGLHDARLDVMAVLVTLWGGRLTFNFARKGGYTGMEDYRWAHVRAGMKPWQFQIFNVLFVSLAQNVLLLLIALPALTAYDHQGGFGVTSAVLTILFFACLLGETIADQQQWNFHQWKKAETAAGRSPNPRFLQSGLFRFSRHPNFFFEQVQWWLLYLIGAAAAGSLLHWTIAGAILLTLLFIGSTRLTEQITLSKYPEYAEYQRRTSAVLPWFTRKPHAIAT